MSKGCPGQGELGPAWRPAARQASLWWCSRPGCPGVLAPRIATHTGALASDGRVWQAVLADAEAVQVTSTQDLVDTLAAASSVSRHGGRAMILTDGGGNSVMAIDALTANGLSLATLSAATKAELATLVRPPRREWRRATQ